MRFHIAANRWLVRWCLAWASLCGGLLAAEPQPLVVVQRGELPIILSAPHGGQEPVPGAEPRKGEGLERKPGGFVTVRDAGTEELAQELADAVALRFGKRPYFVISRAHRKYLDPNRAPAAAYEGAAAKAVYDAYHAALEDACRDVRAKFHTGLLLDLHGQGSAKDTVFRGTKNGATVASLRQRFGEAAHVGEASLWGQLKRRGWTVHPDPFDGREQSGFTGGYIVQRYSKQADFGIDAVQLEFGASYRSAARRLATATVLADALADYAVRYLDCQHRSSTLESWLRQRGHQPDAARQGTAWRRPAAPLDLRIMRAPCAHLRRLGLCPDRVRSETQPTLVAAAGRVRVYE